jgi:hypothetical protein
MSTYKLYKAVIEKEFVIAMPADKSIDDIEKCVENIMAIHEDCLRQEGLSHILVENINHQGDLPGGWDDACLPYLNYSYVNIPEELVNKPIKEYLNGNH